MKNKKMYYVTTPNKSFSGKRHGVQFYKGQAMGEFTEAQAQEMKNDFYEVEEVNGELDKKAPAEQTPEDLKNKAQDNEKPEEKKEVKNKNKK